MNRRSQTPDLLPVADAAVTLCALLAGLAIAILSTFVVALDGWSEHTWTGWQAVSHRAALDCGELTGAVFLVALVVAVPGPRWRLTRLLGDYRSTAAGVLVCAELVLCVLMFLLLPS